MRGTAAASSHAELIEDGRCIVGPTVEERAFLDRLAGDGIARVVWDRVVRCFEPCDDADLADATDRACRAWVSLPLEDGSDDETWQEDSGAAVCPGCGRLHRPRANRRSAIERARVTLNEAGIRTWMETQLRAFDPNLGRLGDGIGWRLAFGGDELVVVWLDRSVEARASARAFATVQSVVYLVTAPRQWSTRFRDDPQVVLLPFADWYDEGRSALDASAFRARTRVLVVSEPALRPWARVRSPEPMVYAKPLGARRLAVGPDRALLDDVEVLGRDATGLLPLLRFFFERWREDVGDGKAPDAHCTWSPEDILAGMQDTKRAVTDSPGTIRRQITRLRTGIAHRYLASTGVALDDDAVVQNVGGEGYRLNPVSVLATAL